MVKARYPPLSMLIKVNAMLDNTVMKKKNNFHINVDTFLRFYIKRSLTWMHSSINPVIDYLLNFIYLRNS